MGFGPNFVTSFQYYLGQTTLFLWVLVIATVELYYQIDQKIMKQGTVLIKCLQFIFSHICYLPFDQNTEGMNFGSVWFLLQALQLSLEALLVLVGAFTGACYWSEGSWAGEGEGFGKVLFHCFFNTVNAEKAHLTHNWQRLFTQHIILVYIAFF